MRGCRADGLPGLRSSAEHRQSIAGASGSFSRRQTRVRGDAGTDAANASRASRQAALTAAYLRPPSSCSTPTSTPHSPHSRNCAAREPCRYRRRRSACAWMSNWPAGSDIQAAPCARQKLQSHARGDVVSGASAVEKARVIAPQWQPPSNRECVVVIGVFQPPLERQAGGVSLVTSSARARAASSGRISSVRPYGRQGFPAAIRAASSSESATMNQ